MLNITHIGVSVTNTLLGASKSKFDASAPATSNASPRAMMSDAFLHCMPCCHPSGCIRAESLVLGVSSQPEALQADSVLGGECQSLGPGTVDGCEIQTSHHRSNPGTSNDSTPLFCCSFFFPEQTTLSHSPNHNRLNRKPPLPASDFFSF